MTITNGYATLIQIKATDRLNITDTISDTPLEQTITSVSRAIDKYCSRYFYKTSTGSTDTRYFTPAEADRVFVGDFVSITALYTDTQTGDRTYPYTWATTDYDLFPYNAGSLSEQEPYQFIEKAPRGLYQFPCVAKGVKLTAVFGWPAVPAAITEACLLWSMRMFERYKTPLGVSGTNALGSMTMKIPPPDPDVREMLKNYQVITV
jgi:hypothetical protein